MTRIIALLLLLPSAASADVAAFRAADADGSGALDYGEFTALVGHMAASGQRVARFVRDAGLHGTAFGRVDLDGDGLATPAELLASQAWIDWYRANRQAN